MTIHAVHSTLRVAARAQHDHWQEGLGIVKRVGTVRRDRCSENKVPFQAAVVELAHCKEKPRYSNLQQQKDNKTNPSLLAQICKQYFVVLVDSVDLADLVALILHTQMSKPQVVRRGPAPAPLQ